MWQRSGARIAPRAEAGTAVSPAAKTLTAWFEALKSGDELRIKELASTYKYPDPEELLSFDKQIGGVDLASVTGAWQPCAV